MNNNYEISADIKIKESESGKHLKWKCIVSLLVLAVTNCWWLEVIGRQNLIVKIYFQSVPSSFKRETLQLKWCTELSKHKE